MATNSEIFLRMNREGKGILKGGGTLLFGKGKLTPTGKRKKEKEKTHFSQGKIPTSK